MEVITTLPLSYQLTALLLLILSVLLLRRTRAADPELPPGPWALPFIGHLHHLALATRGGRVHPHHALRNLARLYGPIMLLRTGQTDLVVITSRDAAKEVMKTQDAKFSDRPVLSSMLKIMGSNDLAFSNGPYWVQMRRICVSSILSSERVKSFSSIRREEVHSLLKDLSTYADEQKPVKLVAKLNALGETIVARASIGRANRRHAEFCQVVKEAIEQSSWFSIADLFPSLSWLDFEIGGNFQSFHRVTHSILDEIIQEHLEKKQQYKNDREDEMEYDLTDALIEAKESDDLKSPITFAGIKAIILDMFIAGADTTISITEWAIVELIKHPEIMMKAQAEVRHVASEKCNQLDESDLIKLNYMKLVIKETLRLHPPAPLLVPRKCKTTCEVLGYTIPSEARVVINAWAIGRDPEYWRNADEFIPERFEGSGVDFRGNHFEFIPFGAGRRICPGMEFGMVITELVLSKLLLHFDWKLPDGIDPNNIDMTENFGAVTSVKYSPSLIPVLRVHLPDI